MKLKKIKIFIGFSVFISIVLLSVWGFTTKSVGQQDKKSAMPVIVEAVPVVTKTLEQYLDLTANVKSDLSVILKSEVSGRIETIHFKDGENVKKGQVLITLSTESEKANVAQEKANLNLRQSTLNRVQQLYEEGIISAQKLDEAKADLALAKANVDFAQAELNKKVIRAPFNGVVGIRAVNIGDLIQSGAELVSINDNSKVRILFELPASLNNVIAKETVIKIVTPSQSELSVPVSFIEQNVNESTRTLNAQVLLDQTIETTNLNLVSGEYIKIKVPTQKIDNANVIPEQALLPRGTKTFIYAIKNSSLEGKTSSKMASLIPVTVLLRSNGMVAIEGDIQNGDLVVTAGQQKLRGDSIEVSIKKARLVPMIPSAVEELPRTAK